MPRSELLVDQSFDYAISGEFQTQSDPRSRSRNLRRVANSSVRKGKRDPLDRTMENWMRFFRYVPTWANSVQVTAVCEAKFRPLTLSLNGIVLKDSVERELLVCGTTLRDETPIVFVVGEGVDTEFALDDLGGLVRAKTEIAQVTQEFFDRASVPPA